MFHLASVLLLSLLVLAGNPVTNDWHGRNHVNDSVEMIFSNSQQESATSMFAASLTRYYVGITYRGPNWTPDTAKGTDEIAKKNQAYMAGLVNDKKLVGAGRVVDGENLQWILFFKGDSLQQAKALTEGAPAVQAGRFTADFRQLWGTRGVGSKMAETGKAEAMRSGPKGTYYLAVLTKGPKWSAEESESTRKLLNDQISQMWKLHQEGTLKFYGVFDDRGDIRGFGILQAKSLQEAKALLKDDPALKAGWFTSKFCTLEVAEGVLP